MSLSELGAPIGAESTQAGDWDPSQLSDLHLWYRADRVDTASGKVVTLYDLAGKGNHATQSTAASRATWVQADADFNGQDSLSFAGAGPSVYPLTSTLTLTAVEAYAILIAPDPTSGTYYGLWVFGSAGGSTLYAHTGGDLYDGFGSATNHNQGDPTADMSAAHCYNPISTSSEFTTNINGAQHYTTATNTVAWSASPKIGGNIAMDLQFDGKFAELIVCSAKQSAGNVALVETYLASRYGITFA